MDTYLILDDFELSQCSDFANEIQERHKFTSQRQRVDHTGNRYATDYVAKACEVAVAKYLKIKPDFTVNEGRGGDGGFDLKKYLADGTPITIDVKHSTRPGAERLIWPLGKSFDYMATVLVFVTSPDVNTEFFGRFCLHGWITSSQFMKLCQEAGENDPIKNGTNYMFSYTLTPMEYL